MDTREQDIVDFRHAVEEAYGDRLTILRVRIVKYGMDGISAGNRNRTMQRTHCQTLIGKLLETAMLSARGCLQYGRLPRVAKIV